jgi:hypothetical protein
MNIGAVTLIAGILCALYFCCPSVVCASSDTAAVDSGQRDNVLTILSLPEDMEGEITVIREHRKIHEDMPPRIFYTVYLDDDILFQQMYAESNPDFEQFFQNEGADDDTISPAEDSQNGADTSQGKYYGFSPYGKAFSLSHRDSLEQIQFQDIDWLAGTEWQDGLHISFFRDHYYNYGRSTGMVNLQKPTLVDMGLSVSYIHSYAFLWFGGGLDLLSQYIGPDTEVYYKNTPGWRVLMGIPGFMWEVYRDPRALPRFSRYEDSIFDALTPERIHTESYAYIEHISTFDTLIISKERIEDLRDAHKIDTMVIDTLDEENGVYDTSYYSLDTLSMGITAPKQPAQAFHFRWKQLYYSLFLDLRRYTGPVHDLGVDRLPFFDGHWGMGLYILPGGDVFPYGSVAPFLLNRDVSFRGRDVSYEIKPLTVQLQVLSRDEIYFSLSAQIRMYKTANNSEDMEQ